MNEIWKDIKGYEGLYQVSNLGNIRSLYNYRSKGHILKQRLKCGYYQIGLRKNNKRKWFIVHRLVAKAFLNNPKNLPQVNHKDENKLNNCVDNLEWCSVLYNNTYGDRIKKVKNKVSKKILQLDLSGNLINEFQSISEASRKTKINISNIELNLQGKYKQTKGYTWKLVEGSDAQCQ